MENIHKNLKEELKEAMKEKNKVKVSVIRDLLTAFTNKAVETGEKAHSILDDEAALGVIKKKAKQRKDSIESFKEGDRDDLVKKEQAELEVIEEYLPEQLSDDEVEKIIDEVIKETGAEDMSEMGQVMSKVMDKVGAQAEGGKVSDIVKQKLQ
ncbi:MAG TPA: GatB/YqeY domain-containing protein [Candidatus Paceibacterota bacterium]|nr:GatB/YqeY domain-containing protein [Candidatus Paceibacterota bacterium]